MNQIKASNSAYENGNNEIKDDTLFVKRMTYKIFMVIVIQIPSTHRLLGCSQERVKCVGDKFIGKIYTENQIPDEQKNDNNNNFVMQKNCWQQHNKCQRKSTK